VPSKEEESNEVPETNAIESMESKSKSDDHQEVTADVETTRISNLSLNDEFVQDQDLPDEMIQYLSMSASEQSNGQDEALEAGEQNSSVNNQREEVHEEIVDDKADETSSI
jgi:hypothetical protein